jgi:hypothetical protein
MSTAQHLLEEPREATAALESALLGCPQPTFFGEYPFSTQVQRDQLDKLLATRYLTVFEWKWTRWVSIKFDVDTAAEVITQLERIVAYRRATGREPVYKERSYFWPDTPPAPPQPAARPRQTRKPRSGHD